MAVQEFEGQGAQLKHEAAVIQFDQMELEGYGPFRSGSSLESDQNKKSFQYSLVCLSIQARFNQAPMYACLHCRQISSPTSATAIRLQCLGHALRMCTHDSVNCPGSWAAYTSHTQGYYISSNSLYT